MKLLQKKLIISLIDRSLGEEENEKQKLIYNFIARRNDDKKWEVEFSYKGFTECKLQARRGEVRVFPRLNGVEKFMEQIGVTEFTVIL